MISGAFIVGIIGYLFFPLLIVRFWRKRPLVAYIMAMVVMLLVMISLPIIQIFQTMIFDGTGAPELMAGSIAEAIVTGIFGLVVLGPVLFLFQWLFLRGHKKKLAEVDADKIFS